MLRAYVEFNQKDWDLLLTNAEIAYNNAQQDSTQQTPFMLNYGQHPHLPLDLAVDGTSECKNPAAVDRIKQLQRSLAEAKKCLLLAQQRQAHYADQHRRELTFALGDQVMLSTTNLRLKVAEQTPKLMSKFIGPFKVLQIISPVAYRIELPPTLSIHPVFHVSRLKPYRDGQEEFPLRDAPPARPPPEILPDGEQAWEVDRIVARRERKYGRGKRIEYLVLWKDFPEHEKTWEPASSLMSQVPDKVNEFLQNKSTKPSRRL
jgi:hypothetical protein